MALLMKSMAVFFILINICSGSDITSAVFGNATTNMPAAFGDFNSDKLTDIFVIRENGHTLDILLAGDQEPLMQFTNLSCGFKDLILTSVVPGDFNGDTMMDVMVTSLNKSDTSSHRPTLVHIFWGRLTYIECSDENKPVLMIQDQPLAIDYNQDMITDLLGKNLHGNRSVWIFSNDGSPPKEEIIDDRPNQSELRHPHSHSFIDLNGDYISDIMFTTYDGFEIWLGGQTERSFTLNESIPLPPGLQKDKSQIGQSLFLDVELKNEFNHIVPVCYDALCTNSSIVVYSGGKWISLQLNLKDALGNVWGFVPGDGKKYTDLITLRGGDFNLDGYPDLLATLQTKNSKVIKTFLLENVECKSCPFSRKYSIQWDALGSANNTVMGAFFDFYQNGILDVILVQIGTDGKRRTIAFKNSLDYDANFIKVMVLTGLPPAPAVGKIPYGTNLPGPRVSYYTVTQEGEHRFGCAAQLQQSAHFPLQLPFSIFGLGRTPNFVDKLVTGFAGHTRDWLLVIPNSQMVVVPAPVDQPAHWRVQLFVTPSKTIIETMAVLLGTCALNALIICGLHLKEKREDRLEKLQEAHRFHFDAM
jgi:integrin alpha FG-GAP repeat containing protein 1